MELNVLTLASSMRTQEQNKHLPFDAGGVNSALNFRDCISLCLSDETLKAVDPFYLVSTPGEVRRPTKLYILFMKS